MSGSVDWQHPYVDIFRQFGVFEAAAQQTKGQISVLQDNEIGRKVVRLTGSISANNTVMIPPQQGKQLGLTGRYIYVQFYVTKGKYFTIHFDLQIKGRETGVKFSLSNMFENNKVVQNLLQIPYPKTAKDKWTILILDVEYFLSNFGLLPHSQYSSFKNIHSLKSIQVCSTMSIRGIYTSQNMYDWETMPKPMLFKLPRGTQFNEQYQIAFWPTSDQQPQIDKQPLKDVTSTMIESLSKLRGPLLVVENEDPQQQFQTQQSFAKTAKSQQQVKQSQEQTKPAALDDLVKRRPGDQMLQVKSIDADDHPLQPYPIMTLERVIGFTVRNCPDIRWGRQSDSQQSLVYAAGNILVCCNVMSGVQSFYMGHSQPISCLDVSRDGTQIVSGQQGKNAVVRLWDYLKVECLSAFATPYKDLIGVSFSYDGKLLVTVGSDEFNREIIIVWGLQNIPTTRKPVLVAKQSANCNVLSIKFCPVDNNRLVSCGHENIKFWRIKNGHLPGASVVLNHHARNTTFAVFDFEFGYEEANRFQDKVNRVFFGSKQGVLFQVNYHTMELETVYRIHDQPISSLVVSAGFCVTGSMDQFLRVWPLDFSEFYIEAKHEGIITSLDVSLDGLQVACGTSTGGLGVLDISNHAYRTVVRSHTGRIVWTEVHPFNGHLITLSEDCTIRLWDLAKQEQVYEFTFPQDDKCTTIASHPKALYFAAGFRSGTVRIFDIENTSILEESRYHDCEIVHLTYSTTGHLLLVSDVKSLYRVYDSVRAYQPVKTLECMHLSLQQVCLEYLPSKYNYSAFSVDNQVIATVGDNGVNINLFDGASFAILLKIHVHHHCVKLMKWAPNNIELLVGCEDANIRIYGIERSPGAVHAYFLREQLHMHRDTINSFAVSDNLKFLFSVGKESFVKVWDYEFSLKGPGSCQVFLGHSNPITQVCLAGNDTIITAGGDEGIFVWSFKGYTGKQHHERMLNMANFTMVGSQSLGKQSRPQLLAQEQTQAEYFEVVDQLDDVQEAEDDESPTRLLVEPVQSLSRKQQLQQSPLAHTKETFGPKSVFQPTRLAQDFTPLIVSYVRTRLKSKLKASTVIPYTSSKELPYKQCEVQPTTFPKLPLQGLQTLIAYNQHGHDNVVWCQAEGWVALAAHNYVVLECLTQTRQQKLLDFAFEVGVLALDPLQKFLLVGAAHKHGEEAPIVVVDTKTLVQVKQLSFHTRGVQKMVFTANSKYLVTIGNFRECTVAIWDWPNGALLASSYTLDRINDLQVSAATFSSERLFEFCTVGRDQIYFWAFTKDRKLEYHDVFLGRNADNNQLEDITSVDYLSFQRDAVPPTQQSKQQQHQDSIELNSHYTKSSRTEETELREESRQTIQLPPSEALLPAPPQQQQPDNIIQCVVLGLKSGEMVVMQYGTFKVLLRRQLSPGEINYITVSQSAARMLVCTTDHVLQWMDLPNTLAAFLAMGLQMNRVRLPTIPIAIAVEPLMQQAVMGFNSGNISLVSLQEGSISSLLSTAKGVNMVLVVSDQLIVTCQTSLLKFWQLQSGECISEFQFGKMVTSLLYDAQFKCVVAFLTGGEIKVVSLERLDLFESYVVTTKGRSIEVVSSCYGVFDGVAYRLVLSEDGVVYTYEQLYSDGDQHTIRMSQVLNLENGAEIVALGDKKVIFVVERDTGIVSTMQVDYNEDRNIQLGFTLIDVAEFKLSPHGTLDNPQQQEQTRLLYEEVSMRTQIAPARGYDGVYFAILDGLSYLYGRNYHQKQNVIQIGLSGFPLCLAVPDQLLRVYVGIVGGHYEVIDPSGTEESRRCEVHLPAQLSHLRVGGRAAATLVCVTGLGICIYNQ